MFAGLCAAGFLVPMTSFAATHPDENKTSYGRHITDADAVNGKTDIVFGEDETIDVSAPDGASTALALDNKETDVNISSEGGTLTLKASAGGANIYRDATGIRENILNGNVTSKFNGSLEIIAESKDESATGWRRSVNTNDDLFNKSGDRRSAHVIDGDLTISAIASNGAATGIDDTLFYTSGNFEVKGKTTIELGSFDRMESTGIYSSANDGYTNEYHFNQLEIKGTDPSIPHHQAISITATGGSKNTLTVDNGTTADMAVRFNASHGLFTVSTDDRNNAASQIILNGENYLISQYEEPPLEILEEPKSFGVLFMIDESINGEILVNKGKPAKQTLKGIAIADTGTIDITLNTRDTQDVRLSTMNLLGRGKHEGTMNMEILNQATWHSIYYNDGTLATASQVSTLTMGSKGNVDVRQYAEIAPDNYNNLPSLYIINLKGNDGIFTLQSDIANATSQYIQILKSSEGSHYIDIKDAGGAKVEAAKPMLVVKQDSQIDTGNSRMVSYDPTSDTSFNADFKILHPVDVGPYTYIIGSLADVKKAGLNTNELTDDNDNNFYLYTDGKEHPDTTPDPNPNPNPDPEPNPDPKPAFNPSAKGSMVRSGSDFLFGLTEMQTLRQRLGDIRHFSEEDWEPWAKVIRTKYERNEDFASMKSTMNGVQFGAHKNISRGDGKAHVGLYGSYLDSKNTYDGGRYDGKYYGLGLYGSMEEENGYYDLVLRYGRSKGDLKTATSGGESITAKGHGRNQWGISLETGKRYQWEDGRFIKAPRYEEKDGFFMEPQAQLAYTRFGSFDMKTTGDLTSHQDGYGILLGRIGPQVEYVKHYDGDRALSLYGKIIINRIFNGKPSIIYNETNEFSQNFKDTYLTWGIGASYTVKDRYEIYGEWERSTGGDWEEKYRFDLGVKYHF